MTGRTPQEVQVDQTNCPWVGSGILNPWIIPASPATNCLGETGLPGRSGHKVQRIHPGERIDGDRNSQVWWQIVRGHDKPLGVATVDG